MKLPELTRRITIGKGKHREVAEVEFNKFNFKRVIEYGLKEQSRNNKKNK